MYKRQIAENLSEGEKNFIAFLYFQQLVFGRESADGDTRDVYKRQVIIPQADAHTVLISKAVPVRSTTRQTF